jgi:hypothetical protein
VTTLFPAERVSNEFGGDSFPQSGKKISNSISSVLKRWHIAAAFALARVPFKRR